MFAIQEDAIRLMAAPDNHRKVRSQPLAHIAPHLGLPSTRL
jgi:hypothetical protein